MGVWAVGTLNQLFNQLFQSIKQNFQKNKLVIGKLRSL